MARKNAGKTSSPRIDQRPALGVYRFSDPLRRLLTVLFPLIAAVPALYYLLPMASLIEEVAFPLDAAYVPITFARNLLEHGAYSFHATDMVTSGAMAPLQVFLLALLGVVIPSGITASMVLGILCFAASAALTFRLGILLFPDRQWMAAAAALLVALSPHLAGAAVAGLPTMLFAALILASATAYFARRSALFFLFAGLALWVRPDALIFLAAAILHLVYNHAGVDPKHKPGAAAAKKTPENAEASARRPVTGRQTAVGALLFLLLAAGYAIFNVLLGGSVLPAAVESHLAYYSGTAETFFADAMRVFTYSWSSALLVFALLGLAVMLARLLRRRPLPMFMSAATVIGFVFGYALIHPVILNPHLLLPVIPFFVLLGLWGLLQTSELIARAVKGDGVRTVSVVVIAVVAVVLAGLEIADWRHQRSVHYRSVEYLLDRHVAMGKWIAENTAGDALVATHVPGAIGWYGDRAVIDIKGAVSPDVIPRIGDLPALTAMLDGAGVDYIATVRDEFEVVNVNPLVSSSRSEPSVAEVFRYIPTRTHIMSQRASVMNLQAAQLMQQQDYDAAVNLLERSLNADPFSSRTNTLLGITQLQSGDTNAAITSLRQALALHPQYAPAMVPLGDVLVNQKNFTEGLRILRRAARLNPQSTVAKESLKAAEKAQREDSLGGAVTFSFELAAPSGTR